MSLSRRLPDLTLPTGKHTVDKHYYDAVRYSYIVVYSTRTLQDSKM